MRGPKKAQPTILATRPIAKKNGNTKRRDEGEEERLKALDNMKNHEAVYMEYLGSLAGKKEAREQDVKRERERVEELIEKNSKFVLKIVSSFFEEMKDNWMKGYHCEERDRLVGPLETLAKRARQKLSKIRKLSESFVNRDYDEDLIEYAIEKDLNLTIKQIQEEMKGVDVGESKPACQVQITLKKEKVSEFFFALQELVHFSIPSDKPNSDEKEVKAPNSDEYMQRGRSQQRETKDIPHREKVSRNIDMEEESKSGLIGKKQRQVLKSREPSRNNARRSEESDNSTDSICLKKYVDDNVHYHSKKSGDRMNMLRTATEDSKQNYKENLAENSSFTAKDVYDLSKNSVTDLLTADLRHKTHPEEGRKPSPGQQASSQEESPFYLHFFQPRSNRLHVVNRTDGEFRRETMELGEFVVPRYHRSLLTNEAVIILTGGSEEDLPSSKSYLLDIERSLFMELAEMNMGRSGHAMVAHGGLIYVIGGVSEDRCSTDSCEVFSPQLNTWSEIARLNVACHSACVVSANGSIFKFGGLNDEGEVSQTIERFNGKEWILISFDLSRCKLYSSSLVFLVNTKELLIVGGTESESEYKTNSTYFVKIADCEKTNSVQFRKGPNLPAREGFWTQEIEYSDGRFYMLQNISHQKDKNSVLLDQRRLLEFNPREEVWTSVDLN